ncbi:MAG: DNA-binding protein [Tannerellaceae bacterium]|jgi:hypothetical protein|nr:DNA-binding protein [Tannerellaceae bacterium]
MVDLIKVAKECPSLNLTVQAGELLEMVNYCVMTTRKELEQQLANANTETYLTRKQTAEMLDVDLSTLWRWNKENYLCPIEIGGKRKYELSEVNKILRKGETL